MSVASSNGVSEKRLPRTASKSKSTMNGVVRSSPVAALAVSDQSFRQKCEEFEQKLQASEIEKETILSELEQTKVLVESLQTKYAKMISKEIHATCKKNRGSQVKNPFSVIYKNRKNPYMFVNRGEIIQTQTLYKCNEETLTRQICAEEAIFGPHTSSNGHPHAPAPPVNSSCHPLSDLPPYDIELGLTPSNKNPTILLRRIDQVLATVDTRSKRSRRK